MKSDKFIRFVHKQTNKEKSRGRLHIQTSNHNHRDVQKKQRVLYIIFLCKKAENGNCLIAFVINFLVVSSGKALYIVNWQSFANRWWDKKTKNIAFLLLRHLQRSLFILYSSVITTHHLRHLISFLIQFAIHTLVTFTTNNEQSEIMSFH